MGTYSEPRGLDPVGQPGNAGDPLTAADVKASIARHQASTNAQASRGEAAVISAVDVVDPRTVTGADGVAAAAMAATRPGGTTVLVGSPAAATVDTPAGLLFGDRRLRGCVGGNATPAADLPLLVRLVDAGKLRLEPLISERIGLADVNDAIERQRSGQVTRSLIVFD